MGVTPFFGVFLPDGALRPRENLPVRHLSYCITRITIYFVFNIIARYSVVLYCTNAQHDIQ